MYDLERQSEEESPNKANGGIEYCEMCAVSKYKKQTTNMMGNGKESNLIT